MSSMTSFSDYNFSHPQLGELKGRVSSDTPDVVQFRSLPYATVPARFKPSILLGRIPPHFDSRPHRDFTNYGAACPQIGASKDSWFHSYGGPLEGELSIHFDDLTCLNLSISVPRAALSGPTGLYGLPVMVYVHGGGFQEGIGHVDEAHSPSRLVSFSIVQSMPVIGVNIGYRLNWYGFLACHDLLGEARAEDREEVFNLGLHDQQRAFRWIKSFISGFGGDPKNVTAYGESAGAISLMYHICASEPLFNRAILQSCGVWGYSSLDEKDTAYQVLLEQHGITGSTPSDRLSALRKLDPWKVALTPSMSPFVWPYVHDQPSLFTRGLPTYSNQFSLVASCPWLDSLIVGADHFEGSVALGLISNPNPAKVVDLIKVQTGGGPLADAILQEYDMTADMSKILCKLNYSFLLGDVWLTEPIHSIADAVSEKGKEVYRYACCLSNPWPGSDVSFMTGHHFVEILFLFLTLCERYPRTRNGFLEKQAKEMARRWIAFANRRAPWPKYTKEERVMAVCDDRVGWDDRTRDLDEKISEADVWGRRRYKGVELMRRAWREMEQSQGEEVVNARRKGLLNRRAWEEESKDDRSWQDAIQLREQSY